MTSPPIASSHSIFLDRHLPLALHLAAIIGALAMLGSDVSTGAVCLGLPLVALVLMLWVGLLVRVVIRHRDRFQKMRTWLLCSCVPAIAVMAMLLHAADVPFRAAVVCSRSALDAMARDVLSAPADAPRPASRNVGLFSASDIHRFPGGLAFRAGYGNPFDWNGLACLPDGVPSGLENYHFEGPVNGNWYRCFLDSEPYPKNGSAIGSSLPATEASP